MIKHYITLLILSLFALYSYGQCNPDVIDPLILCPTDIVVSNDPGQCSAYISAANLSYPVVYDYCGVISTIPTGIPSGNIFPVGTTVVTWTATDGYGNFATCDQLVTVSEDEDPVITCASNISVNTDPGLCTANVTVPPPIYSDNCAVASITNDYNGGGANASDTYPLGTTTVTYTVTDSGGRTATCSIDIIVTNVQLPVITLLGSNPITLEACDVYTEYGATANDICLGDITGSIVIDASALDTSVVGSHIVTYNVTNANGIAATEVIRTINIVDTVKPILTLIGPNPISIGDCSTYTELGANATDCTGDYSSSVVIDNASVDTSTLGSYIVTYNVTDGSGNVADQITRTVNVIDVNAPDITLLGANPQILEACDPYLELGATALDPCFNIDYSADIVIDASAVDTSVLGFYNVTYNVMDVHGNVALELIRVVEVVDTTSPSMSCLADIVVGNDAGQCSAVVNYVTPVGSDNCLNATTIQTAGLPSGSVFPLGTTTNTFQVTDDQGFTATCSFDVTVNDTESPNLMCQDITLQLDPITGLASIVEADIDNGSTDNCNLTLSLDITSFDCTNIGTNLVTLTGIDAAGNSSSCNATVTITDLSENASVSISSTDTLICENDSVTFTATPTNGGGSPTYQWQINGIDVPGEITSTFTSSTLANGDQVTVLMTSSQSSCALPLSSNVITMTVNDYNLPANAGPDFTNAVCSNTTITLSGNAITGSGSSGLWTVTSGQSSGFSFSDDTSPTSTFTGDVGETYTLQWSIDNPDPCVDTNDSMIITFIGCDALDFDGVDDNVTFRDNYNFSTDFTIEIWIKSELTDGNIQTIFSKRESDNLIDGFDLRLVNSIISFHWNNGQSLASPFAILQDRWYHLAVTFESGTYTLYIDGIEVNTAAGVLPIINTVDCIIGAMDQTLVAPFKPLHYFDGGMDELRIWNVALSENQIRKMMNQEIEDNGGIVRGSEVPLDISGLDWTDLSGYYSMNQSSDIVAGNLVSSNGSTVDGTLRNITTLQTESAPLPYQTNANGDWTNANTWLFGNSQTLPNSIGIDGITSIDWNIVRTYHNVSSGNKNIALLGLHVISNTLSIENTDPADGQSLRITDYLKIDGTLDLVGESQLLQDEGSIVDSTSLGTLERDQQGTANLYNYNYWSSPVSMNGSTFTVGGVLRDGTDANNPLNLIWTGNHDANPSTSPITMSSRWIYTFENSPQDSYSDWVYKQENGVISKGLGFTMKGSGAASPDQNYVFEGLPNNGTISATITATATDNYQVLVGNPYPSALDAQEFIRDNIPGVGGNPGTSGSIDGNLYFWEHYDSNTTHILEDYEGGYSIYNLSGAVGSVIPPEISGLGLSTKEPKDFIPVGQGFFVTAADMADQISNQITFKNSQRFFVKEADGNSVFMTPNPTEEMVFNQEASNTIDENEDDLIQRVRIEFKSPEGARRPLLLSFVPNNSASDGFNYGYDALNTETLPNDMNWNIDDAFYLIQGVGDFDVSKQFPLAIFSDTGGSIEIALQDLENFENDIDIYIYDSLLGTYSSLKTSSFQIALDSGIYLDRFYLTFDATETLSTESLDIENMIVNYLQATHEIYINVPISHNVEEVELINIVGQLVKIWTDITPQNSREIRIPVDHISEGTYVVKVKTKYGNSKIKKILIGQ